MNKHRRKRIGALKQDLSAIQSALIDVLDEEEEALDCFPESLRESEQGQAMQNAVDCLSEALDALDDASDLLTSAME